MYSVPSYEIKIQSCKFYLKINNKWLLNVSLKINIHQLFEVDNISKKSQHKHVKQNNQNYVL